MKELYIAPELIVTCFAPVERLANEEDIPSLDLGDMLDYGNVVPSAGKQDGDIDLDL